MEHPPVYQVRAVRRVRPSARPRRLAGAALWLAQRALPGQELSRNEAVLQLLASATGHPTLSPADALILAGDELYIVPDIDAASALLEAAALLWLEGPATRERQHLDGIIYLDQLREGQRVGVSRLGLAFTIARIERDGPLTTISTPGGQQLPFTGTGWLIDRTER